MRLGMMLTPDNPVFGRRSLSPPPPPPPPPPPAPVANFTASPLSGNSPLLVTTINTSTGNITSHLWQKSNDTGSVWSNFANGPTTSAPVESLADGTWSLRLTEMGPGGNNTKTRLDYVSVSPPPPPAPVVNDFTASPTSGNAPFDSVFVGNITGTPTTIDYYKNDGSGNVVFGNTGAANVTETFTDPGTFTITLSASNDGGTSNFTRADYITVSPPPPPPTPDLTTNQGAGLPMTEETGNRIEYLYGLNANMTGTVGNTTFAVTGSAALGDGDPANFLMIDPSSLLDFSGKSFSILCSIRIDNFGDGQPNGAGAPWAQRAFGLDFGPNLYTLVADSTLNLNWTSAGGVIDSLVINGLSTGVDYRLVILFNIATGAAWFGVFDTAGSLVGSASATVAGPISVPLAPFLFFKDDAGDGFAGAVCEWAPYFDRVLAEIDYMAYANGAVMPF
jgi:PKD repeat protein